MRPPTPVLARSVHVGSPSKEQSSKSTALTTEAGLNDGLAFPFVYLAIAVATTGLAGINWVEWLSYYALYKIVAALIVGVAIGRLAIKFVYSPLGDAKNGQSHPALIVLGVTFAAYGLTELINGYGFLAVFVAARAGREFARDGKAREYEKKAHRSADQLESILLAVLLLWFSAFVGSDIWQNWSWADLGFALFIVLILRPLSGYISLFGLPMDATEKFKIAFFGIRGMGTVFYIAYAMTAAEFEHIDAVWRIAALTIIVSVLIHGCLATQWMGDKVAPTR